jgi:hypothetical protein
MDRSPPRDAAGRPPVRLADLARIAFAHGVSQATLALAVITASDAVAALIAPCPDRKRQVPNDRHKERLSETSTRGDRWRRTHGSPGASLFQQGSRVNGQRLEAGDPASLGRPGTGIDGGYDIEAEAEARR